MLCQQLSGLLQPGQCQVGTSAQVALRHLALFSQVGIPVSSSTLLPFLARGVGARAPVEGKRGGLVQPDKPARTLHLEIDDGRVAALTEFIALPCGSWFGHFQVGSRNALLSWSYKVGERSQSDKMRFCNSE